MTEKPSAAFFDIDGTLIKGDSQFLECLYIMKNETPPLGYYLKLTVPVFTGILAGLGLMSQEAHNCSYVWTYRGQSRQRLEERGQQLFKHKLRDAFFPQARDLIENHRLKGHKIVLVSATPFHLLAPFADDVVPDALMCTELAFDMHQRCMGYPVGNICMGSAKAKLIQTFAGDHRINLKDCYAYADHHADLPFLEATGHPHAMNPTLRLLKIARERKWPVIRI